MQRQLESVTQTLAVKERDHREDMTAAQARIAQLDATVATVHQQQELVASLQAQVQALE